MNSIVYISNAYSTQFPDNTDAEFKSYIDEKKLNYIPNSEISVAVKSISFRWEDAYATNHGNKVFAVKSNFSLTPIVRSSSFSNIVATFSVNYYSPTYDNLVSIDFENPIFFSTTKELLQRASFKIVELSTNKSIVYPLYGGHPTIIKCYIKEDSSKMKKPFKICLESDDEKSKQLFPNNNNTQFTVQLPKRYELGTQNWSVCLKSLFMTNKLFNVTTKSDCRIQVRYYEWKGTTEGGRKLIMDGSLETRKFDLKPGVYETEEHLLDAINELLSDQRYKLPISLELDEYTGRFKFIWNKNNNDNIPIMKIRIGGGLTAMLGFQNQVKNEFAVLSFNENKLTNNQLSVTRFGAFYDPNIMLLTPTELCVHCNIVGQSAVGSSSMSILAYVSTIKWMEDHMLSFYMKTNDFSKVTTNSFETINIKITDMDGDVIEEKDNTTSTILNLMFVNL